MGKKKLLLIYLALLPIISYAKIVLPNILNDNMVLQQQTSVKLWGKANPNKKVKVLPSWNEIEYSTIADADGKWMVTVSTPKAGGPYEIRFTDGEELTLKNVLIGEVWFCSGQSNMEMPVRGFEFEFVEGANDMIATANESTPIRMFSSDFNEKGWFRQYSKVPLDNCKGEWFTNTSKNVAPMSAVSYCFARYLQRALNVPVGIVVSSWGGSTVEAWMSEETVRPFGVDLSHLNDDKEVAKPVQQKPCVLFNAKVAPLTNFMIKGMIWYQGESNRHNIEQYARMLPVMVDDYRKRWSLERLPFYYAYFREMQQQLMQVIPNSGMVSTMDIGSRDFIHPPKKEEVAKRLAYWALAKTYHRKGIQYSGPIYKFHRVKGNVVEIDFEHGEEGLTPENQNVKGFEIVGTDGIFRPAKAEIISGSSTVKVWNDSINDPIEVRYCFRNYMLGELCNNAAIPASPFRIVIKKKPALMWFDAEANFERFSHKDSIDYYLEKIKSVGFTHAIVDIRPITGEVLYQSQFAPQMKEWKGAKAGNFDYLQYFIKKGHELGLEVHASLNVFCAGHNYFDRGMVYSGHPEWASMVYTPEKGIIPITEEKHKYGAMINPLNEEYRTHILNVLKEVVTKYSDLDGLMLDRVRYDGITADFSSLSREKFEEYIDKKVTKFPEDIFVWKKNTDGKFITQPGKYFQKWMEWRTKNITDFMALARKEVKATNPKVSFGTYTGAWYPSYYEVGVNFASKKYDPAKDFSWATPEYKNYGYAELIDLYATGNYYTDITIEEYKKTNRSIWNETDSQAQAGTWYCVEGSCQHLRQILKDNKFMGGILVDQFYDNPGKLSETIEMNLRRSDGLMVFDIVHIIQKNLWKEVEKGMREGGAL